MNTRSKVYWIAAAILSFMVSAPAEPLCAASPEFCATTKTIASKQAKDVVISLLNETGSLTAGENSFCVVFRRVESNEPADVRNVSMEVSLLAGRIEESAINAQLTGDGVGRYRGSLNLGPLYYKPSRYYAFVHYIDLDGNRRKRRFFFLVK